MSALGPKRQKPSASEKPSASSPVERSRPAPTELLHLDDALLTTIAAKCPRIQRLLGATCKRLLHICDAIRCSLRVLDPCSAGRQILSLSKWPNIRELVLYDCEHSCRPGGTCRRLYTSAVLVAVTGRHLVKLEIVDIREDVSGPLLGQLLKGCQGTLKELYMTDVSIAEDVKCVANAVKCCHLESFTVYEVKPIPQLGDWFQPSTSGRLRQLDAYMTGIGTPRQVEKLARCLGNVEGLCLRACPRTLDFNTLIGGCHSLLRLDMATAMEVPADAVVLAASRCPRLQDFVLASPLSVTALRTLATNCKGLAHLGVVVHVDETEVDAVADELGKLEKLETLQFRFSDEMEQPLDLRLQNAVVSWISKLRELRLLRLGYVQMFEDQPVPQGIAMPAEMVAHVNAIVWRLPHFRVLDVAKDLESESSLSVDSLLLIANLALQARGLEATLDDDDTFIIKIRARELDL